MGKKHSQREHNKTIYALPQDYPSLAPQEDYIFYIQRSLDQNTVVYTVNNNTFGDINVHAPMRIYWKRFVKNKMPTKRFVK